MTKRKKEKKRVAFVNKKRVIFLAIFILFYSFKWIDE
jgi:hypothetical protein